MELILKGLVLLESFPPGPPLTLKQSSLPSLSGSPLLEIIPILVCNSVEPSELVALLLSRGVTWAPAVAPLCWFGAEERPDPWSARPVVVNVRNQRFKDPERTQTTRFLFL